MRCALAAKGFLNEDIRFNQKAIKDMMIACAQRADIVLFGEAFLQGFYGLTFNVEHDSKIAITRDDRIIEDICSVAREYAIAVSFGFIEKAEDGFYSSQITVDSRGRIADVFRRVSPGWKEPFAGKEYREGGVFRTFDFMGRRIAVSLCGDLWYDENIRKVNQISPDIVFWPVYTDFNSKEWNKTVKHEYAEQAGKIPCRVLYVNSCCLDKAGDTIAKGGSAVFYNGRIEAEAPAGQESVLLVTV